jgi:hypothetical protein
MTIDLSFDLETLAVTENAVILEIGAVDFNPRGNDTVDDLLDRSVRFALPIQSQLNAGRIVDASTICWWVQQPNARRLFEWVDSLEKEGGGHQHYSSAVDLFREWLGRHFDCDDPVLPCAWANSPSFDTVKLRSLFKSCFRAVPDVLGFRRERDVRTLKALHPVNFEAPMLHAHQADHDAVYQALLVQAIHREHSL